MSPANIYRFFASKTEIHQCALLAHARGKATSRRWKSRVCAQRFGAAEALRAGAAQAHRRGTMLDEQKVHENGRRGDSSADWHVIEKHIGRLDELSQLLSATGIEGRRVLPNRTPLSPPDASAPVSSPFAIRRSVASVSPRKNRATPEESSSSRSGR